MLSDDINLLLPGPGGYRAHAVPFTGEFGRTLDHAGGREAYPLAGIVLLEQGERLRALPVSAPEAVAGLIACCPFVNTAAEASGDLFDVLIRLCRQVPVIRLASRRDDDVGRIMDAVTAELEQAGNNMERKQ